MRRDRGGRKPSGSFADLIGGPSKSFEKPCARCGQPVASKAKVYCRPCAADRYEETVAANKAKYKAQRLAAKASSST